MQCRRAIDLAPNHGSAHFHRGLIYLLHGQAEQAELALGKALSENQYLTERYQLCPINKDPAVWLTRAVARFLCAKSQSHISLHMEGARQDLEQAERWLSKSMGKENETTAWPHFHYAKGRLLFYQGQFEQSIAEFTKGEYAELEQQSRYNLVQLSFTNH